VTPEESCTSASAARIIGQGTRFSFALRLLLLYRPLQVGSALRCVGKLLLHVLHSQGKRSSVPPPNRARLAKADATTGSLGAPWELLGPRVTAAPCAPRTPPPFRSHRHALDLLVPHY
jgi:hypothetical protein